MWANFSDPHHPWNAPAEFRPDPASLKLPAHWPDLPGMREQARRLLCRSESRRSDGRRRARRACRSAACSTRRSSSLPATTARRCRTAKARSTIRAPTCRCIIRWPGVVKPGGESRELLSNEDIGPTLLAAAGLVAARENERRQFSAAPQRRNAHAAQVCLRRARPAWQAPVTVNMTNAGLRPQPGRAQRSLQVHLQLHALDSLCTRRFGRRRQPGRK